MNGAQTIAAFLRAHGVRTAFGYPGANIIELYDALSDGRVQNIICRHEQGAVHAATGYAKASGRVGVCLATSGPGAANLITGIADADLDSAPLLVITGQVPRREIGRDAFQEADIMGMTIPVTKHNYLVREGRELAVTLEEAWQLASTHRRGPVLVDIAHNVFSEQILISDGVVRTPRVSDDFPLDAIWPSLERALAASERPLILAGGGVVADGADGALARFAAASGIPVAVTLMARGSLIGDAPGATFLGFAGRCGHAAANRALGECDLLIASGTRFSERTLGAPEAFPRRFVVHNDIDAAEISKNVRADAAAVCPAGEFFTALADRLAHDPARFAAWREMTTGLRDSEPESPPSAENHLSMTEVCRALDRAGRARGGVLYVTDVGENQMAAATELSPVVPRGFLTSGGLGTMGFGLPGAVGAAFAAADARDDVRRIVAVVGDGGFQMTVQELATLAYSPLPVTLVLLDNGGLGMLRSDDRTQSFTLYGNPDFAALARAYRLPAVTVRTREETETALARALDAPGSMLVHCAIG